VSTLAVILIVLGGILLVLFVGGLVATTRRRNAQEARFREEVEAANEALAQAHATDKGWDRAVLEQAVRDAVDGPAEELHLHAVIDKPGTDQDEALFKVVAGGREQEVRLGRRDGAWYRIS
jgi:hypothetical protein